MCSERKKPKKGVVIIVVVITLAIVVGLLLVNREIRIKNEVRTICEQEGYKNYGTYVIGGYDFFGYEECKAFKCMNHPNQPDRFIVKQDKIRYVSLRELEDNCYLGGWDDYVWSVYEP